MSGMSPLPVGRGSGGSFTGQSFACMARKAGNISSASLRLRQYEADEARADARESFLRSKRAKRYSSLQQD